MNILVVEDEIYSRQSLVKQIMELDSDGNYKVAEAANGRQGLEKFRSEGPELVFTDIRMPFLSGLDLLRCISEESQKARVIMVSGYAEFDYARQALKYGASGYLLKPVKDDELREVMEIKTDCAAEPPVSQSAAVKRAERGSDIANQVIEYVERHYDHDFSLKYLAEQVFFINHTYLSHLISERTGVGFAQYLQRVRVDKAKELLTNRLLSVTDVASLSGFNDTSRFIQVFKKSTGSTPKKYRERLVQN